MIKAYEIHVETNKTISDILDYFKAQGVTASFGICKDNEWCKFKIKHPSKPQIYDFLIKVYNEMDGVYQYEIMSWDKESFDLSTQWFDFK